MTVALLIAGIALLAAIVLLTPQTQDGEAHPGWGGTTDPEPGDGIIVRDECTEIWIPETWASAPAPASADDRDVMESYETLKKHLEIQGEENLWYVIVFTGTQADGRSATRKMVRQPYLQPEHFEEFQAVVAAARAKPDPGITRNFAKTRRILRIPKEVQNLTLQEIFTILKSSRPGMAARPARNGSASVALQRFTFALRAIRSIFSICNALCQGGF